MHNIWLLNKHSKCIETTKHLWVNIHRLPEKKDTFVKEGDILCWRDYDIDFNIARIYSDFFKKQFLNLI